MRFDSSTAWSEASRLVAANRDVLLALAGVFLVLPLAALAVFVPQPQPPEGARPEELLEMLGAFYRENWPAFVGAALVSMVGTLAMLALFTDRNRPTVGEAIRLGALGAPSVIAARLVLGMGLGAIVLVPLTLAAGAPALAVVLALGALVAAIWVATRMSLISPAVMVDGLRNPIVAMQRSWRLTQGNAGRLLVFYVLVGLAFLISILVAQMVLGLVISLLLPGDAGVIANALIGAMLQAVMSVYFVAVIAACHGQLAGQGGAGQNRVFE